MKLNFLLVLMFFVFNLSAQNTLPDSVKQKLVDRHNYYRHQVGSPNVMWSDKLAASAENWAKIMAKKDRLIHSNMDYGENIYVSSVPVSPEHIVDVWAEEKDYYHGEKINSKNYHLFGHYTQIIWSSTLYIGCAEAVSKSGNHYWVCEYDPAGNYIGEKPVK